jgi:hypothetical protein
MAMKRSRSFILCALLWSLVLLTGCKRSSSEPVASDQAADLLVNRNWLDHWPTSRDEKLYVYRFTPSMGGGVFQDRTLFAGRFELFTFGVRKGELRIEWPHRELKERIPFRIERVKGPKPFDLKLVLDGNSTGPSEYYGRSAETGSEGLFVGD